MTISSSFRAGMYFAAGALTVLATAAVAQYAVRPPSFPDVPQSSYFSESVEDMARLGIVKGYDNGKFGPGDPVTRGQVAVMISRYDAQVVESLRSVIADLRANAGLGSCGDSRVQSGEQCDDGNREDADGCSKECLKETVVQAPLPPTTRRCVSSVDCLSGQVCSTAYGDCHSACPPGVEVCASVCAGICVQPRGVEGQSCDPIICSDGTRYPSCSTEGHLINYFVDPCLSSGGTASAKHSSSSARPPSSARRSSSRSSERTMTGGACSSERGEFTLIATESKACVKNTDCMLYEQSCPYVTCGEAVNKAALQVIEEQSQKVLVTCREEGVPQECASCRAGTVACVDGACTATFQ